MKQPPKAALLLPVLTLALGLTACTNSSNKGTQKPEARPPAATTVAVDPTKTVNAVPDRAVRSVDPTLTSPLSDEVSSEEDLTRVSRDPKNPVHVIGFSALSAGSEDAQRFASYKAFLAARAGSFKEISAEGYSWGYVGSEPDTGGFIPLAGLVASSSSGAVLVCTWGGNIEKTEDQATATAAVHLDAMKKVCTPTS
ncbi:hypothetical protein [Nocardioides sp. Root140]|uniref:hypothetical protein n=1 Tax=Nocardioides sp. Root140 TaxID=1736460 RepID=UPI000A6224B3|nr:hypothetical protein [Nocardioides sp. Root140]